MFHDLNNLKHIQENEIELISLLEPKQMITKNNEPSSNQGLLYQLSIREARNAGELGSIPGSGRPLGEGNRYPLQCYCLENSMNKGAWRAAAHVVTNGRT